MDNVELSELKILVGFDMLIIFMRAKSQIINLSSRIRWVFKCRRSRGCCKQIL